ncbi:SagB/ThcOx family dehydrogenase [Phyllobacterium sp. 0TCS1.6C]|uniref:SagB/ThcOx family dehydrogenase n=1 Tax=unclassified Phyllobacterium TaxID=2638441 RepID=UPI00226477C8|nr:MULTISPECIES: SagB/ThcOx family dehydrogenase [unclassified Phyllobacterium]MCX8281625.1 SagB/ThcOx family dehydrogenase [Phyllobacterium sp. 0TCS1.6C]MCX8294735.1 SagB/ThcOx family dehydrogenase [Phyllobacterium sp. 0TCS1.6A]
MRLRCARTLIFHIGDGGLIGCNFLGRSVFNCAPDLLAFLCRLEEWADEGEVAELMSALDVVEAAVILRDLLAAGALVAEHSELAVREAAYAGSWRWGIPAAAMHFCVQDADFMSLQEARALQLERLEQEGSIALFEVHGAESGEHRDALRRSIMQLPKVRHSSALLELMARRRSSRLASGRPLQLRSLAECLFAGLGITGRISTAAGDLPLTMTPSGGARNPYEAYVLARNVEGLVAGIYHYSAAQHSLARLDVDDQPAYSLLTGGQEWVDTMPCLVVLCALMDRTMWKYVDANAYRVVLMEAGHIGQNIILAATARELAACPTAALAHSRLAKLFGLTNPTHAPIYAVAIGNREPHAGKILNGEPHLADVPP